MKNRSKLLMSKTVQSLKDLKQHLYMKIKIWQLVRCAPFTSAAALRNQWNTNRQLSVPDNIVIIATENGWMPITKVHYFVRHV